MICNPCRPTELVPKENGHLLIHIIVFQKVVKNKGTMVMAIGMPTFQSGL
jgi:hypothetical protein